MEQTASQPQPPITAKLTLAAIVIWAWGNLGFDDILYMLDKKELHELISPIDVEAKRDDGEAQDSYKSSNMRLRLSY